MPEEIGIFYIRHPELTRRLIGSMAFVRPLHVTDDGQRSSAQMVDSDPALHSIATIYRQRNPGTWDGIPQRDQCHCPTNVRTARQVAVYLDSLDQVTPALEAAIDRISREISDFYFRRFHIRFRSIAELQEGRGFSIAELNGAGAEMLQIRSGIGTLRGAWTTLWRECRDLLAIGAVMRRRGTGR